MAELKTKPNDASVEDFLNAVENEQKRQDSYRLTAGHDRFKEDLKTLGKHKIRKSCLYIKKLDDINEKVLSKMIKESIETVKKRYSS